MSQSHFDILNSKRLRNPFDKFLPDGRTLAESIREKLISPTAIPQQQPGQQVRYVTPDQHGALPQPINAPTGGTPLPQSINAPTGGVALAQPQTVLPAVPGTETALPQAASTFDPSNAATRPWKAGYGVGETDPLKRDAARIRAMIENPISKVNPDGSVEAPHPMSRKKAALLGLLMGMGQAAQGHESPGLARVLAGGATGATIGLAKPRAIQQWERRNEVGFEQGQLGQQQKTAKDQATVESEQAEARQRQLAPEIAAAEHERKARYDAARIKIQQDAAAGRITAAEARQKLGEARLAQDKEQKELDRAARKEIAGGKETYDITLDNGTVVKGNAHDAIAASAIGGKSTKARAAKLTLHDTLYGKAENNEQNSAALDEHIKKWEDGIASFPQPDPADAEAVKAYRAQVAPREKAIAELKAKQEKLRTEAARLRVEGDRAKAEADAIPEDTATVTQAAPRSKLNYETAIQRAEQKHKNEGKPPLTAAQIAAIKAEVDRRNQ